MESTCEGVPPVPTGSTFTGWDYLVFAIILAISAAIGIYYACSGGKQKTTQEYLLADKSMPAFPVALSLFASYFSTNTLLGMPAEIYTQGTMYWMCVWGAMLPPIVGAFLFGPFFHRLKILSVFEYLELRYKSKVVRTFGCLLMVLRHVLNMGIIMFGPATALNQVTGIPVWAGILTVGLVCVFYTTLGGLKAVIWTDAFQATLMITGLLAPIIQGCIETGGIENAWQSAEDGGRIEFFDFNPDPTVRHTFWNLVVGSAIGGLCTYGIEQQMIQRYTSAKNPKQAQIAVLLNIPAIFILITLASLLGVVTFGYYAPMKCDPLASGRFADPNQLVPGFVMDVFGFAPGIAGLYMASIFAGALSSISSMLSALGTIVWEDIFKLFRPAREASDKNATIATKLISVFFAACGIGLAFLFSNVGGTVLQMSASFTGAVYAPILGIFMLGLFFPWANWIGALAGGIPGFLFPMWISIGAYVEKPPIYKEMSYNVECCDITSDNYTSSYFNYTSPYLSTTDFYTTPTTEVEEVSGLMELYSLSYMWYTTLGMMTTIIIGLFVSLVTGYTKPRDIDPKLLIPYVDKFWCCFPESCRAKFRCGIDYSKVDDSDSISENGDEKKSVDAVHNGIGIIFVSSDPTDHDGSSKKQDLDRESTGSVHSSQEPSASTDDDSYRSETDHRNLGCDNDAYECLDEVEIISKL